MSAYALPQREIVARRSILRHVRAIAEIPQEVRRRWVEEINGKKFDRWTPEEALVFLVLINLPVAEEQARVLAKAPTRREGEGDPREARKRSGRPRGVYEGSRAVGAGSRQSALLGKGGGPGIRVDVHGDQA